MKWKDYLDAKNLWLPEQDLKYATEITEKFYQRHPDKSKPRSIKTKNKRGQRKSAAGQSLHKP